jgi:hypothetical protein
MKISLFCDVDTVLITNFYSHPKGAWRLQLQDGPGKICCFGELMAFHTKTGKKGKIKH